MKSYSQHFLKACAIFAGSLTLAHAGSVMKDMPMPTFVPHWYVGANMGVSHLYDKKNSGSNNSVSENGPGGSVLAGYQFTDMFGLEAGYTQYYNSKETLGSTIVAKTEHYAVDLAGTAQYPFTDQISGLAKLGLAYAYAQKMAIASGVSQSDSPINAYWGLGFTYHLTSAVDAVAQFSEAVGNSTTGSSDLWSLGFIFGIV